MAIATGCGFPSAPITLTEASRTVEPFTVPAPAPPTLTSPCRFKPSDLARPRSTIATLSPVSKMNQSGSELLILTRIRICRVTSSKGNHQWGGLWRFLCGAKDLRGRAGKTTDKDEERRE